MTFTSVGLNRGMNLSSKRKMFVTAALVGGAFLGSAGLVSALSRSGVDTPPVTTVDSGTGTGTDSGTPKSNEDTTHEAGETTQREADEAAGRGHGGHGGHGHHGPGGPGGRGHSNTDTAHEAAESPERVAEEAKDDAANASTDAGTDTTAPATTAG